MQQSDTFNFKLLFLVRNHALLNEEYFSKFVENILSVQRIRHFVLDIATFSDMMETFRDLYDNICCTIL